MGVLGSKRSASFHIIILAFKAAQGRICLNCMNRCFVHSRKRKIQSSKAVGGGFLRQSLASYRREDQATSCSENTKTELAVGILHLSRNPTSPGKQRFGE